jgi:hypothetical protein
VSAVGGHHNHMSARRAVLAYNRACDCRASCPVYTFVVSSRPCMPNKLQLADVCRPDRDQAGLARQVKRRYILYVMFSGTLTLVN